MYPVGYIHGIITVYIYPLQYIYHKKSTIPVAEYIQTWSVWVFFLFLSAPLYHAMWIPGDVYVSCSETQRFSRPKSGDVKKRNEVTDHHEKSTINQI